MKLETDAISRTVHATVTVDELSYLALFIKPGCTAPRAELGAAIMAEIADQKHRSMVGANLVEYRLIVETGEENSMQNGELACDIWKRALRKVGLLSTCCEVRVEFLTLPQQAD